MGTTALEYSRQILITGLWDYHVINGDRSLSMLRGGFSHISLCGEPNPWIGLMSSQIIGKFLHQCLLFLVLGSTKVGAGAGTGRLESAGRITELEGTFKVTIQLPANAGCPQLSIPNRKLSNPCLKIFQQWKIYQLPKAVFPNILYHQDFLLTFNQNLPCCHWNLPSETNENKSTSSSTRQHCSYVLIDITFLLDHFFSSFRLARFLDSQ